MSIFGTWGGSDCAVQMSSRTAAAMMPGRSGAPPWYRQVAIPADAVRPGLQGTNLEPAALAGALKELAAAAPRKIGAVTLILPDACAKLRIVPIEAEAAPGKRVGAEIVRWALSDALPFPVDEALVDTQLFDRDKTSRMLVAAAHRDVLRQYEDAAAALGPVVRTLPATLACCWNVDDETSQHLLVHADHDTLGCLVSGSGAPLFVRTRPLPKTSGGVIGAVMETLDYAAERLGIEPGEATVWGRAAGDADLEAALGARGWSLRQSPEGEVELGAQLGALVGALRAAEVGP